MKRNTGITGMMAAAIEEKWLRELAAVNESLADAETMAEYMTVLQDSRRWGSLSYSLRRYVYQNWKTAETDEGYTVKLKDRTYAFSPVEAFGQVSEEELDDYADLLHHVTLNNRCFAPDKSGRRTGRAAITKQQYRGYLSGQRILRKNLFTLSFALGFGTEDMEKFMNVVGESPVYNFRSARECIYFFCHSLPELRSQAAADQLEEEYALLADRAEQAEREDQDLRTTEMLHYGLEDIVYNDYPSLKERKAAFLDYLRKNAPCFTEYSKQARELLWEELYTPCLLDVTGAERRNARLPLQVFADVGTQKIQVGAGQGPQGDIIYGELTGDNSEDESGFKLSKLQLDRRMTANFTDGAHLRSALFAEEERVRKTVREFVTKKDFLLLRLYKLNLRLRFHERERRRSNGAEITEEERLELLNQFQSSTDYLLAQAGLPPIYVADPLDHTVMCALCSKDPLEFFGNVYQKAPKKGAYDAD